MNQFLIVCGKIRVFQQLTREVVPMRKCLKLLLPAEHGVTLGNGHTFALPMYEKKGIVLFALNVLYSRLHPLLHHSGSDLLLKQHQLFPAHQNVHNLGHLRAPAINIRGRQFNV